ncbi:MAG: oligosaccharide flippase family protein [Candidatus Coprovivens sp.]
MILLIGGCLTKILGLIIKIIYTRNIGLEGVTINSLIAPTYSLLITLANFNMIVSISKRISSNISSKKVLINSCYIMFILDLILIIIMFLSSKYISINLLKNPSTYYPLLACSLTLPFISIGYIIKGYFYGKQNMTPHMISNVLEQLFRLIIISTFIPKITKYGSILTITIYILFNIISESVSIIIFLFFLPKNIKIKKEDLQFNYNEIKEILGISIPSIAGRLLGNLGFFLEPIVLTNILSYKGLSINYITTEYAIYNTYTISTLLFPSFFITAISNSLLPEVSNYYSKNKISIVKKRIKQSLIISLIIGLLCTITITILKEPLLKILYNTKEGIEYINILAPFFILFYLESPLVSALTGINKIKHCTIISTTGIIIKLLAIIILGLLNFKIYSLIIAEIINIIYVTTLNYITLKKAL